MYSIINDRIFWIYLIVTLFFLIIGVGSILMSNDPNFIILSVMWLLGNIALMIIVYHTSIKWGPPDSQICFIDDNSGCFDSGNRVWLFVNFLFIALLIISILWAGELGNSGSLNNMSGILILLGGLMLFQLLNHKSKTNYLNISFWICIFYLVIWFGLTLYSIIN
jgi:hypothetical protein